MHQTQNNQMNEITEIIHEIYFFSINEIKTLKLQTRINVYQNWKLEENILRDRFFPNHFAKCQICVFELISILVRCLYDFI